MQRLPILVCMVLSSSSCASSGALPKTLGEQSSGFGYIPLDGLPVAQWPDENTCDTSKSKSWNFLPLPAGLPDLSVRFAVASLSAGGTVAFGPAKVTEAGQSYRAVLDYVNVDAVPMIFFIRKRVRVDSTRIVVTGVLRANLEGPTTERIIGYDAKSLDFEHAEKSRDSLVRAGFDQIIIPVYVGIGMRLTADIRALQAGFGLTSLGAIAAAAQTNILSGTLTVQTLGITGRSVATVLPLPSRLDQTTVENGVLALGNSRSAIYSHNDSTGDVIMTPRVVGLYSPVGSDPLLINAIYSELASQTPPWRRPCKNLQPAGTGSH